jgi:hypothetical protein
MAKSEAKKLDVPRWSVRLAVPDDMAFVLDSWLRTSHRTYPNMHATEFFQNERARVQRLVESSLLAVAHLEGDLNELLGHLVYGQWRKTLLVHYAFVKPDARRHGVFTSLVAFANFAKAPVVLTAPAQDEKVMSGLMAHYLYDQRVLPLMQRGDR